MTKAQHLHNRAAEVLKRDHDLTGCAVTRMRIAQSDKCAACEDRFQTFGTKGGPARLVIDHDHQSGAVRKLLCSNCNTALGLLKESSERILRLLWYIQSCPTPSPSEGPSTTGPLSLPRRP